MIGQTISHYRILKKLGDGAMSVVYVAEDLILKRQVAFKVLTAEHDKRHFHQRMLREARAVSSLNHRNIATIHEYGETSGGLPYIVMELVDGQTLSELISSGTLTLTRALQIIEDVAQGLSEAHQHKIVHRDIKPSNVAVNRRGDVKILDFGLAKRLSYDDNANGDVVKRDLLNTQTREGVIIGTPMYLSPEQALGVKVDERSDLFSLGALLYECISGRPAFDGRSAMEICAKIIRDDPPPLSRFNELVPPELNNITFKALAKKIEERYQSADEILIDLRQVRESLQSTGDTPAQKVSYKGGPLRSSLITTIYDSMRQPRLYLAVFLASLCLALLTFGVVTIWNHRVSRHTPSIEAMNYYKDGTNALRDGTYLKAARALQQAINLDDDFTMAHVRLAEALAELDYTDKAKNELLRINSLSDSSASLPPLDQLYMQAIGLKLRGDSGKAIEKYKEIASRAPDSDKAAAYVDLARAYERDGNVKKAVENYSEAHRLDPQFSAASIHLGVLWGRQLDSENTQASLVAFRDAETRYQILNDMEGQAEVLYERGVSFITRRKLDEARDQMSQALMKSEVIDDKYQQIKIRLQLSSLLCLAGETDKAQQEAAEVLKFARENSLEALTANSLINLGNAFMARGDLSQAEKYLNQALEIAQYYKARRSEGKALLVLASFYTQHQGKTDRILDLVRQAAVINEQEGYRKYAIQAQAILGHASDQMADYDSARKAFEQQLGLAEQLDDQEQVALSHEGLGIMLNHREQYVEALKHLNEDYRISQSLASLRPNLSHALLNRGRVFWQVGNYKDAQDSLDEVLRRTQSSAKPDKELLAWLHLSQAQMALSRRQFELAKSESRAALELSKQEYTAIAAEAEYTKGEASALSGATQAGRQLCDSALESAKELGAPRLIAGALLAQSIVMLEAGDSQQALDTALQAGEMFDRSGQQHSQWRAWFVAAIASKRTGDEAKARSLAQRASYLLYSLQQNLGDLYADYSRRPDVVFARRQLMREFNINH
jgi:serine/threonine protein kinase